MSIDKVALINDDACKVLNNFEGHFSDVKTKRIRPKRPTKTINAFANADGGELFIGIEEGRHPNESAGGLGLSLLLVRPKSPSFRATAHGDNTLPAEAEHGAVSTLFGSPGSAPVQGNLPVAPRGTVARDGEL